MYAVIFRMSALLLLLLLVLTARPTREKQIYFPIINYNIECSNDDFETSTFSMVHGCHMNAFQCLLKSITMLLSYTYLQGHFAIRQTKLRLAIRFSHPVLFNYSKTANIIHDV